MSLLEDFPGPWTIKEFPDGAWQIKTSNGSEVMYCASYTGDGATLSLSFDQARELVNIVNSSTDRGIV